MRISSSPRISALKEHPTPQYAHVVSTVRTGMPKSMTVFSCSVPVGHAWTQAPHETHSLDIKSVPPGETRESKPRPSIVKASVPWTSSHARTHLLQTMHLLESNVKYGLLVSFSSSKWLEPA
ncbi:unannotated protein [freshwater metagenome]|uniref:Unannotated protein n=1 Tax=freshwater metagenome TaxID=449393 RepID=A0A6J5ZNA4_9ZZZZ